MEFLFYIAKTNRMFFGDNNLDTKHRGATISY